MVGHCSCRGEGHGSAIWIVGWGLLGIWFFEHGVRKERLGEFFKKKVKVW